MHNSAGPNAHLFLHTMASWNCLQCFDVIVTASHLQNTLFWQSPNLFSYENIAGWGTGSRGLIRCLATIPQGNQESIAVKAKNGRPQISLGWAGPWNVILFPFSALTWLGDRKGIRPVKSWVTVCCRWWFDWSLARLIVVLVVSIITSIILSSKKSRSEYQLAHFTALCCNTNYNAKYNVYVFNLVHAVQFILRPSQHAAYRRCIVQPKYSIMKTVSCITKWLLRSNKNQ